MSFYSGMVGGASNFYANAGQFAGSGQFANASQFANAGQFAGSGQLANAGQFAGSGQLANAGQYAGNFGAGFGSSAQSGGCGCGSSRPVISTPPMMPQAFPNAGASNVAYPSYQGRLPNQSCSYRPSSNSPSRVGGSFGSVGSAGLNASYPKPPRSAYTCGQY